MAIKSNLGKGGAASPLTAEMKLPSGGLLYGASFPESIVVSPYNFTTQGMLTMSVPYPKKMAAIASHVAALPQGFDIGKMITQDVFAILMVAKSMTWGDEYRFTSECDECGHKEPHVLKVPSQVPVTWWSRKDFATPEALQSHLSVTLPHSRDVIVWSPLTLDDESEVSASVKRTEERFGEEALLSAPSASGTLLRMARRIRSVNNTLPENLEDAINYCKTCLVGRDMAALIEDIEKKECGIQSNFEVKCASCSAVYKWVIEVGVSFFR